MTCPENAIQSGKEPGTERATERDSEPGTETGTKPSPLLSVNFMFAYDVSPLHLIKGLIQCFYFNFLYCEIMRSFK